MTAKKRTFEQALAALEDVVARMEEPDIGLEECVKLYKTGVELSVFCGERLDMVEKEVSMLQRTAGEGVAETPFDRHERDE